MTVEDILPYIHKDDREKMQKAINVAMTNGTEYRTSYRVVKPDGSITFLYATGNFEMDGNDNPVVMFGTIQDMSSMFHEFSQIDKETLALNTKRA